MGKAASLALVVLFVLSAFLVASSSPAAAANTGCTHTYSAPPGPAMDDQQSGGLLSKGRNLRRPDFDHL